MNREDNKNNKELENNLDEFLGNEKPKKECVGDECVINDGKEIVIKS